MSAYVYFNELRDMQTMLFEKLELSRSGPAD